MIVVTGTHRSGTSLWMQVLRAAGLPVLGERFPRKFSGLSALNPEGFWETRLRMGINFLSNPDPATGIYLAPDATRDHVVKIFVQGLVRSDLAYLDHVLATLRPWREHSLSMARLIAAEEAPLLASGAPEALAKLEQRRSRLPQHPPVVEWWTQLYALVLDLAIRRYPHRIVTFGRLLRDPAREVAAALAWLGDGEPEPAVAAVRPELRSFHAPVLDPPDGVDEEMIAVFDAVYAAFDEERTLEPALLRRMNETQRRVRARWPAPS